MRWFQYNTFASIVNVADANVVHLGPAFSSSPSSSSFSTTSLSFAYSSPLVFSTDGSTKKKRKEKRKSEEKQNYET
jgi:hypothetical protein